MITLPTCQIARELKIEYVKTSYSLSIQMCSLADAIRTTKGFHCKGLCKNRTYMYVTPTFAFAPKDTPMEELENFRLSEAAKSRINSVIQHYVGTKNYYNFTSGRSVGCASIRSSLCCAFVC